MAPSSKPLYDEDRPDLFPAYQSSGQRTLQIKEGSVFVGRKDVGLDVHFPDRQVLHYDLEGRLLRVGTPNVQWRRGLSGDILCLRKRSADAGGGFERQRLTSAQGESLIEQCHERMQPVLDACQTDEANGGSQALAETVARAAGYDSFAADRDVVGFKAVYQDIPILPPDQYASFVLLATEGCRYNHCTFCGLYRQARFRNKGLAEFQDHLSKATDFVGQGLSLRRAIFLGQANALMGPRSWREAIFTQINQAFELPDPELDQSQPGWWKGHNRRFTGITSFLDGFVGQRMHTEEFRTLRRLNLRRIFIGMESGDQRLLDWLKKPSTPEQMLQTVEAARAADVRVAVIVLIGAGGEAFYDQHVRETVRLIRAMQLGEGDCVYLSPLIEAPMTEYAERAAAEGIKDVDSARLVEQEQQIRTGIKTSATRKGPYVAHYEVANFLF